MENCHLQALPKKKQEPSPRNKEIEHLKNDPAVSNQKHHRRQSKNRVDGLQTSRSSHKQDRTNNCNYLNPRNNGNTIGIKRENKNKIRYKSDPSGKVINLSKHSFSSTFKQKS